MHGHESKICQKVFNIWFHEFVNLDGEREFENVRDGPLKDDPQKSEDRPRARPAHGLDLARVNP